MADTFKTYRTATGAHVHVNAAWGDQHKDWTELKTDALDVNGKPLAPYHPIEKDLTAGNQPGSDKAPVADDKKK